MSHSGGDARGGAVPPLGGPARAAVRLRWSPANTVIALAALLIVVVFAIFAFLCVQGYHGTVQQAQAKAQAAADISAEETGWMLGGGQALLAEIAALTQNPIDITDDNLAAFNAGLKSLPAATSLGLYDATGNAWGDAGTPSLPENIADADFFKALEAGGQRAMSRQLADATTGKPIFVLAQRLGTDAFGGIAVLTISGDVTRDFWQPQSLGAESTTSIVRDDGWLMARYPALPAAANLSRQPPFTDQKANASGTYMSASSPVDGVARVVAFRRLPALGVIIFASVSRDAVLAGLWNSIFTVLWLMLPIALALLAGSLITARILRQSERTRASLEAAVAHNDVLFREIHHRVKNNLQSVASLLQMQPIPREIKADMNQRIAAMSAVHEHIYRSSDFATVGVKDYLERLVANIRAGADPRVEVVEQFEDLSVDKDAATPLGLILNEVVSNAFKHAFSDGRAGVITITLFRQGDGRGQLSVEDNGVGFDPTVPGKGIGRRLIAALTQQLNGESWFESGSLFTLVFPLAK